MFRNRNAIIGGLAALFAAGLLAAILAPAAITVTAPTLTVIRETGVEPMLAAGNTTIGVRCDGAGCPRNQPVKSTDQGVTWSNCAVLPSTVWTISRLHTGTLIAATDGASRFWRSSDGCASWQPTAVEDPYHPGTMLSALPQAPFRMQTLGPDSIADDGTYGYFGTYNNAGGTANLNAIYRTADDGQTWRIASTSTTHKHIHSLQVGAGGLYVLFGDTASLDGVYVSHDHGASIQPVCANRTDDSCILVSGAVQGSSMYSGTDNPYGGNAIVKINVTTGSVARLLDVPYEVFSSTVMPDGSVILPTTYEARGTHWGDTSLHVYAVVGDVVTEVWSRPIPNTANWASVDVRGVLSDGTVVFYRSGYGGFFARLNTGLPVTSSTTTTTTAAGCG